MIRRGALAAAALGPQLSRRRQEHALRRRCARRGALALTYDDGPGPRLTPQLLDLLGERGGRATFYALGERAAAAPEVLDRAVREAHEVGCHGYAHINAAHATGAVRDIERGYQALAPWVGARGIFRPPYGKRSAASALALRRRGAPLGWWTVDSGDALLEAPDLDAVVDEVDRAGGGVVLLHDFDRGPEQRDREAYVLRATAALLDLAERRGWRVVPQGTLV